MRYAYPAIVQQDKDGITVTFPDVPEAITWGTTVPDALKCAADALISALATYVEDNRTQPAASPARGRPLVGVTALDATKLALHDAMLAAHVSDAELAKRLGSDDKVIRLLRDPLRHSDIGVLETALRALGKRVAITVEDAV